MKLQSKRIVKLVLLVVLGVAIGIYLTNKKPVVVYKNNQPEAGNKILPASYKDDLSSAVALNEAFVKIAKNVSPAVVTITTTKLVKTPNYFSQDPFFRRFFNLPEERKTTALGSGVIVNEEGYILTNNHVVENGEEIIVKLDDRREFDAEIIGTDSRTDLAVIKIDAKDLPAVVLGDSEALRVGEWVSAIGSPLREDLAHTITAGIVSAKGRNLSIGGSSGSFIQTDAAINPGNSGGALVNIRGELVGINTAIATDGGRGNIGIGFAIPINLAKKIMQDLIEDGKVSRAWVGVSLQPIDDATAKANEMTDIKGALVNSVVEDSPADEYGLEIGDIIIKVNDDDVKDVGHLQYLIASKEIDEKIKLTILRNGKQKTIKVKLAEMPEDLSTVSETEQKEDSIEKYGIKIANLTPDIIERFDMDSDESGVLVTATERGSKFKAGDIIKRLDNKPVKSVEEFKEILKDIDKEYFMVLVKRGGTTFFVTLETK